MNVTKRQTERKLLSEDCWIDVEDCKVRIDYMTRSQETEYRRLAMMWRADMQSDEPHYVEHYIRCAVQEFTGATIEDKPAKLVRTNGKADKFVTDSAECDFIQFLLATGIHETVWIGIVQRLSFDDMDKKKQSSQQTSSKAVISESVASASQGQTSLTHGAESIQKQAENELSIAIL